MGNCLECFDYMMKESFNAECIETAYAVSVRGGSVVPCGEGRSPLRRRASSPVRGFDFPCTRVGVPLYGQTGFPTRGMHSPYTEVPFSLRGGLGFPTRRKGCLMRRMLWYNLMRMKTENADENGRSLK